MIVLIEFSFLSIAYDVMSFLSNSSNLARVFLVYNFALIMVKNIIFYNNVITTNYAEKCVSNILYFQILLLYPLTTFIT